MRWNALYAEQDERSQCKGNLQYVAIALIQPPKKRPADKSTRPMMRPEDIIRNRTMLLVPSG